MNEAADIEAQAAAWIAHCDADGGEQDPQLAAWLIADPRHRAAYLRLLQVWERTRWLARLRPADSRIDPDLLGPSRASHFRAHLRRRSSALTRITARSTRARGARASRWLAAGTAAAGLALAVLLAVWNLSPLSSGGNYGTGPGGLARIFLPDGSAVTMNANTEIRVHFTAARRTIKLLRGEAHFSVTHDVHRPFEVHAGDRVVVAVGTAFNIRLNTGHIVEVTVTEGRVALFADGDRRPHAAGFPLQTISAGQEALLTAQDVTIQRIDRTQIFHRLAWEHRELSFEGQTLSQAVADFNRYTNRRVVIDDPSIAALQIGGSFRALDIDSFVAAVGRTFGISSRTTAQGTIHLYRVGDVTPARHIL